MRVPVSPLYERLYPYVVHETSSIMFFYKALDWPDHRCRYIRAGNQIEGLLFCGYCWLISLSLSFCIHELMLLKQDQTTRLALLSQAKQSENIFSSSLSWYLTQFTSLDKDDRWMKYGAEGRPEQQILTAAVSRATSSTGSFRFSLRLMAEYWDNSFVPLNTILVSATVSRRSSVWLGATTKVERWDAAWLLE